MTTDATASGASDRHATAPEPFAFLKTITRPLVASDANLQRLSRVPIDVVKLFGSRFHANANAVEWRAGVTLWLRSWHQTPAGTLPADDDTLMNWCGLDAVAWDGVRVMALRGWKYCLTNALLYHTTMAEVVNASLKWKQRQSNAAKKRWEGHEKKPPTPRKRKKKTSDAAGYAAHMHGLEVESEVGLEVESEVVVDKNSTRDISTSTGLSTTLSASAPEKAAEQTPTPAVFMRYPLLSYDETLPFYDVTEAEVERWRKTYPRVDVRQVLRELLLWAEQNPGKRKTSAFAPLHISKCMERQQRRAELDQYRVAPGAHAPALKPDYSQGTANNRRSFLDADE